MRFSNQSTVRKLVLTRVVHGEVKDGNLKRGREYDALFTSQLWHLRRRGRNVFLFELCFKIVIGRRGSSFTRQSDTTMQVSESRIRLSTRISACKSALSNIKGCAQDVRSKPSQSNLHPQARCAIAAYLRIPAQLQETTWKRAPWKHGSKWKAFLPGA